MTQQELKTFKTGRKIRGLMHKDLRVFHTETMFIQKKTDAQISVNVRVPDPSLSTPQFKNANHI